MSLQRVSEGTFFQAKPSHCLSSRSSSVLGAGSLYVVSSTIIQIIARGFPSREFASRSPFARKCQEPITLKELLKVSKSFWHMSACAPPFSLQDFPSFVGHISSLCCARKFKNYLSVLYDYYGYFMLVYTHSVMLVI